MCFSLISVLHEFLAILALLADQIWTFIICRCILDPVSGFFIKMSYCVMMHRITVYIYP